MAAKSKSARRAALRLGRHPPRLRDGYGRAADGLGRARAADGASTSATRTSSSSCPTLAKCRSTSSGRGSRTILPSPSGSTSTSQLMFDDRLKLRTFERGAGETLACGTGACASAVAAIATKRAQVAGQGRHDRRQPDDRWAPGEPIRMRGSATHVFERRARPGGAAVSVETITLGCRLNFAESETIARSAPADEDWIVVNSCAVTNEAVRQTRQAIRRAHRRQPDRANPRHRLRRRARSGVVRGDAGRHRASSETAAQAQLPSTGE